MKQIPNKDEAAMSKIQALIAGNRGWPSEQDMLEDMVDFRRRRSLTSGDDA